MSAARREARARPEADAVEVRPATRERWPDLEELFGPRGACAGCWCMWWRLPAAEFRAGKGEPNRAALRALTEESRPPGLLAYAGGRPVAWCAVAPRADYPRLARARVLAAVDDASVWSITCFYVARGWRRRGLTLRLLAEAARFARAHGARLLEGYPVDPKGGSTPDVYAWTGFAAAFARSGFVEVARRSPTRPIVRRELARRAPAASPSRRAGATLARRWRG